MFRYKNHLEILHKWKTIYIKRFTRYICAVCGTGASHTITLKISKKLATGGLWILRYHRSRFFPFLFFMLNLSGNNIDKFNKSCGVFLQESNKTGFEFF
jgi:hypothetical protein